MWFEVLPDLCKIMILLPTGVIDVTYSLSHDSDKVQVVATPKAYQPKAIPPCQLEATSSPSTIRNITRCNMGEATHVKRTTVTSKQLGRLGHLEKYIIVEISAPWTGFHTGNSDRGDSLPDILLAKVLFSFLFWLALIDWKNIIMLFYEEKSKSFSWGEGGGSKIRGDIPGFPLMNLCCNAVNTLFMEAWSSILNDIQDSCYWDKATLATAAALHFLWWAYFPYSFWELREPVGSYVQSSLGHKPQETGKQLRLHHARYMINAIVFSAPSSSIPQYSSLVITSTFPIVDLLSPYQLYLP